MARWLVFLVIAIPILLLACGGGGRDGVSADLNHSSSPAMAREMVVESEVLVERFLESEESMVAAAPMADEGFQGSSNSLETAQRKVISFASMSLEVDDVKGATARIRTIAESSGGFVEALSSSGGPARQRANMTVRVLQEQFFSAMERIEALGVVLSRDLGSEDVSEQFIDLEARQKSALREEQSLLRLLERADLVSEVLSIERELSRVRSDIERFQGQLNFLERRVELATIHVSLEMPEVDAGEPPSASLSIEVPDVSGTVARVKGLVDSLNGVIALVVLHQRDGKEQAEMSLRVLTDQFKQVTEFLEAEGKVRSKEVVEGTVPMDGGSVSSAEPDAHIDIFLAGQEDSGNTVLIAAIAAPLGSIALVVVLGLLVFWVYRAGQRS